MGEDGELLRGTMADAHMGKRLAIDQAALLRESLAQARDRRETHKRRAK